VVQQNITEEDEEVENVLREKIKIPDLDLSKFIQSITIDSISSFESHSIPPPQKVNITEWNGAGLIQIDNDIQHSNNIDAKPVDVGANHSIVWKDVQCTIDIKEGVKILSISLNDADFLNLNEHRTVVLPRLFYPDA
jgi:hypothetical protein